MIDLRCGDCNIEMKKIDSHSVDLVLTDPPYNLGLFMQKRETNLQAMRDNYFGGAGWDNMDFEEWKQCTILQNGEDIYILDSKFYRFGFTGREEDLPETTSIQKQITYGDYIKRNSKIKVNNIYNAFLLPYDKKREVFQSNDNLQYIGFAKSTWKDNSEGYEFVHAFLIDLKHVVKTWNRFNHKEDIDILINAINEQHEKIMTLQLK